jgi:hypothetical protein
MVTKQRVFSPNNTIHYDDYLKIKQGTECLKTIHSDNHNKHITINQFVNYEQFMYLSKAFYKQVNTNKCKHEYVTNLYNANMSYIKHNQDELNSSVDLCNSPVLYPYGQYRQRQTDYFYFPYKLDMKQMCRENETCKDVVHATHINIHDNNIPDNNIPENNIPDNNIPENNIPDNNIRPTSNCKSNNSKKCKTGLCKNAKQLFI